MKDPVVVALVVTACFFRKESLLCWVIKRLIKSKIIIIIVFKKQIKYINQVNIINQK